MPESFEQQQASDKAIKRRRRAESVRRAAIPVAMAAGEMGVARDLASTGDLSQSGSRAANLAGSATSSIAKRKGVAAGKAAAGGGAVAAALSGEGAFGIGQSALSWYALWLAFSYATIFMWLEPVSSLLAVAYLDIHYIASKRGSKWFREMFLWQKIYLAILNMMIAIILLVAISIIIAIVWWFR